MRKKKGFTQPNTFIIDLRKDDEEKVTNEKPVKIDITLDGLAKKFMKSDIKNKKQK